MYRHRLASTLGVMLLFASTVTLLSTGGAAPAEAATSTPSCTFNGSHLPIVFGVSSGKVIDVSCTGLPPLHPYLLAEASLLAGIDPAAKAVLSGGITSLSGLLGALTALKEINMGSVALPFSDLNGDLNYNWTVPSSQPLDPNASCPPSTEEFNSGLIGCALAMIDLTSFTPVGAGSALMQWTGESLYPPPPTLALSKSKARPGTTVNVSDAPGNTTFYWVNTLSSLEGLLGGTPAPTKLKVTYGGIREGGLHRHRDTCVLRQRCLHSAGPLGRLHRPPAEQECFGHHHRHAEHEPPRPPAFGVRNGELHNQVRLDALVVRALAKGSVRARSATAERTRSSVPQSPGVCVN